MWSFIYDVNSIALLHLPKKLRQGDMITHDVIHSFHVESFCFQKDLGQSF